MKRENHTPFQCEPYAVSDKEGGDVLLAILKATYEIEKKPAIAGKQEPIQLADDYYGEPDQTSIKYASDFSFGKTATDVALIGHAHAPGSNAGESYVSLKVGQLHHMVKVFGDRVWKKKLGKLKMTSPQPFERIPILYERAFGGFDDSHQDQKYHDAESRNPVGVGFRAKKGQLPEEGSNLPNFEDPGNPITKITDRRIPAGFGFIAPSWAPRIQYAGTYDDAWRKNRMPLLPDDFDTKFFNAATPALVYPGFLEGGEPVEIGGVSPRGAIRFDLPAETPECIIHENGNGEMPVQMNLDKVVVDADEHHLIMVWSGNYKVQNEFRNIDNVVFNLLDQA
jgi:hypothetical protein